MFLNQRNKFSIGFRYQWNWLRASNSVTPGAYYGGTFTDKSAESFQPPEFAYHIGYEHKIINHNTISTKVGRSFRYPNLDERIGLGSGFNNFAHFSLGPQRSQDFEFSHKLSYEKFDIATSFYYMRLRSEISTTDNSFYNRNLAPTERFGIENSIKYSFFENLNIENDFTIAQAKFRGGERNGNDLPGVPAFVKNVVEIKYKLSLKIFQHISMFIINLVRDQLMILLTTKLFRKDII